MRGIGTQACAYPAISMAPRLLLQRETVTEHFTFVGKSQQNVVLVASFVFSCVALMLSPGERVPDGGEAFTRSAKKGLYCRACARLLIQERSVTLL